ncbi:hypothetical protein Y032_0726g1865 [Ancylostoma ceylanicum]|uniref:BPTI/Kunitz inhibitor domain-containing protein n=1 Tax=Ancylostoma ceylanicum TaxID=53326 RepID=A0A016WGZ2_9BILA|nr:hypothetical protein Y032_0726g1865 [Ancylostoma ceylanicum]
MHALRGILFVVFLLLVISLKEGTFVSADYHFPKEYLRCVEKECKPGFWGFASSECRWKCIERFGALDF